MQFSVAGETVQDIRLPEETAVLKSSPLPGYQVASQKCGICHSADYINLQPPNMSFAQWTAEMVKMQHAYGAPITDSDIKLLSVYLTASYGDAATLPGTAEEMPAPRLEAATRGGVDVDLVLARNNCLTCHALTQKVVGPAYHDVAIKYKNDPDAGVKVQESIRAGGSGKWGPVPMPAFPKLDAQELQALSEFVLKQ
jgi:cytochrome c551/c552